MPRILSWAVRITAGLMLAYMLAIVMVEGGAGLNMFAAPDPHQLRWIAYTFVTLVLVNLLVWPLWCGFANLALQARVHPELKSHPLMAALWFFIPGAFLFMPWPVVREVYLASQDPTEWADQKAPIVGWWWWTRLVLYFGVWPLSSVHDPQGEHFVETLAFQGVIIVELVLEILLMTRMAGWQTRLSMKAAEVF